MKNPNANQSVIISEIKRIEDSLKSGINSDVKKMGKSLKGEIKKTEKVLREEMLRVEERVERLEDKMKKQHDEVMTSVSNFGGRLQDLETENEIGSDQIRILEKKVAALKPAA